MPAEEFIPPTVAERLGGQKDTKKLFHLDPYLRRFETKVLEAMEDDDRVYTVLEETCFHPEGGGQPADRGHILGRDGRLEVLDAQIMDGVIVHVTRKEVGGVKKGDLVQGEIDWEARYAYMKHHTASHIVFSALRKVLGVVDLQYLGFQIGGDRTRIDINYGKPIPSEELEKVERLANSICLENRGVKTWHSTREEVEKTYGGRLGLTDVTPTGEVRVVEIEDWDVSLCSGTHVRQTVECSPIKILGRFRLQRGVERIEFSAGRPAYEHIEGALRMLDEVSRLLGSPTDEVSRRVRRLLDEKQRLKEEIRGLKAGFAQREALGMLEEAEPIGGLKLIVRRVQDVDGDILKRMTLALIERDPSLIVVLGSVQEKAFLVGRAGPLALDHGVDMAKIIKDAAEVIDGAGGGKAEFAQAGGRGRDKLDSALETCREGVLERLK
ncbi:MAG: DHHA1 domain-containing protein [Candidatus Geothermarchaeales archaeon]